MSGGAAASRSREPSVRRRLLRWAHRFAAVNVTLLMIVGVGYLWRYSPVGVVGGVYSAMAYLGHLAVLAYVPLVLVLVPAACWSPVLGSSCPSACF